MHSTSHLPLLYRLARLYDEELRRLPGMRVARGMSFLVSAISCVVILSYANAGTRGVVVAAVEGLRWLSWLAAGLAALSAAHHWRAFQRPLHGLASDRGVPLELLTLAAPLALVRRLSVLVGVPALGLAGLALALTRDAGDVLPRVWLLLAMPTYALLLAVGLALLTQAAASLAKAPARVWLMALVVGPHVLRELWPLTPSVVFIYDWLLQRLLMLGGAT